MNRCVQLLLWFVLVASCLETQKHKPLPDDAMVFHNNHQQLTNVIVHDVFSPPVASRIYAYTSLAEYEAVRFHKKDYPSLTAQLRDFPAMPLPEEGKEYNFILAATKAFFEVARNVRIFSYDSTLAYQDQLYANYHDQLDEEIFNRSVSFGEAVAKKYWSAWQKINTKKPAPWKNTWAAKIPGNGNPLLQIIVMEWNHSGA